MKDVSACKPEACAIQVCMKRSGYNDAKCKAEIEALYTCCRKFYARNGPDATNKCCPRNIKE